MLAPCTRLLERQAFASPAGADSRALAPHSLRERDLARCSQRGTLAAAFAELARRRLCPTLSYN